MIFRCDLVSGSFSPESTQQNAAPYVSPTVVWRPASVDAGAAGSLRGPGLELGPGPCLSPRDPIPPGAAPGRRHSIELLLSPRTGSIRLRAVRYAPRDELLWAENSITIRTPTNLLEEADALSRLQPPENANRFLEEQRRAEECFFYRVYHGKYRPFSQESTSETQSKTEFHGCLFQAAIHPLSVMLELFHLHISPPGPRKVHYVLHSRIRGIW